MDKLRTILIVTTLLFGWTLTAGAANSATNSAESPATTPRYALAANMANTYSPGNEIQFAQLVGVALYDYDQVWPHQAPEPLRFKIEAAAGLASTPHTRAIISVNMLALYFIEPLTSTIFHPYLEAGIGLIYTDLQVDDQGLRCNFNPQLGIGSEISVSSGATYFCAARLHHISNGGLDDNNRGINSILFQLGRYF